ncbi:uncharacterized protein LOC113508507 [Trichoplusia ni]|uniref:Uncharacterized protein LOC113508507 n=1 Tax=Trichoplusia ni TaxID=7111 RepID=A0A7E5X2G2_TRINI|nr:uncharacterized protein LOC113508507 [Trichoplusia ni]
MSRNKYFIVVSVVLSFAALLGAQSPAPVSRCFQFTWLGPRWNNESTFLNATCQDATQLSKSVPCFEPLVVSLDGTWPDVEYIWRNHAENASCILAANDVCAQHTYYFDGKVDNSTYLCTRAVNELGAALTSGCYEERKGSFVTRTCFCRSVPGGMPCNSAALANFNILLLLVTTIIWSVNTDLF